MATIAHLPNGKYKAIVKQNGRIVKTKTFLKKSAARQWAKMLETDSERLELFITPSSRILFSQLSTEYLNQVDVKDMRTKIRMDKFWSEQFGSKSLNDINSAMISPCLEKFRNATRNRYKAHLSSIFIMLADRGMLRIILVVEFLNLKNQRVEHAICQIQKKCAC